MYRSGLPPHSLAQYANWYAAHGGSFSGHSSGHGESPRLVEKMLLNFEDCAMYPKSLMSLCERKSERLKGVEEG